MSAVARERCQLLKPFFSILSAPAAAAARPCLTFYDIEQLLAMPSTLPRSRINLDSGVREKRRAGMLAARAALELSWTKSASGEDLVVLSRF